MRPVERGPTPRDEHDQPRVYPTYGVAREDLIDRIGAYCSYCEMAISVPAVEHVQPKSLNPALETAWDNFLLGCPSCNSIKGAQDVQATEYLWPDIDNTFRAFRYDHDLPPRSLDALSDELRIKAQRTLELMGLDRVPGHARLSPQDRRWRERKIAWGVALRMYRNLSASDTEEMRETIAILAREKGFFSVWMTVFQTDSDMKQRFIRMFTGTARDCFDEHGNPIRRPGRLL